MLGPSLIFSVAAIAAAAAAEFAEHPCLENGEFCSEVQHTPSSFFFQKSKSPEVLNMSAEAATSLREERQSMPSNASSAVGSAPALAMQPSSNASVHGEVFWNVSSDLGDASNKTIPAETSPLTPPLAENARPTLETPPAPSNKLADTPSGIVASMLALHKASVHALSETLSTSILAYLLIPLFVLAGLSLAYLLCVNLRQPARRQEVSSRMSLASAQQSKCSLPPTPESACSQTPSVNAISSLANTPRHLPLQASARASMTNSESLTSKRSPRNRATAFCLCKDLVVPADNECNLMIPRLLTKGFGVSEQMSISDAGGKAVFAATFRLSSAGQVRYEGRRLTLQSVVDGDAFAFCSYVDEKWGGGFKGLGIFHTSEGAFGVLTDEGGEKCSAYTVRARTGRAVFFRGDVQAGSMQATDEEGRLLAVTVGPTPQTLCVRIGPRVDAGLITLALLGVDLLEHDRRARGQPASAGT